MNVERTEAQQKRHEYYLANKEKKIAQAKDWQKKNKKQHKKFCKNYVRKNNEHINQYNLKIQKRKYHSNIQYNLKAKLLVMHSQFLKGVNNVYDRCCGMNLSTYKQHVEMLLEPDMTWNNYGKVWRIERKKGLKELDLTTAEDIEIFCNISNIKIRRINY